MSIQKRQKDIVWKVCAADGAGARINSKQLESRMTDDRILRDKQRACGYASGQRLGSGVT